MKKALIVCTVTLAGSLALAVNLSSLQVSQATRNTFNQLLNTNPSETTPLGASRATVNTSKASGVATGADASMTGKKVKAGAVSVGNFVTQDSAMPTYNKVLTPTGHAAVSVSNYLTKSLPKQVSAAANNVVATVEFTGNATAVGVTGMAAATKVDATAVANTKPGETNLHGTAQGVSNAATVGASTADSQASGAFSSAPMQKINAYKQLRERQQLVKDMAAETLNIAVKAGVESKDAMQAYVQLGQYASLIMTGKELKSNDANFDVGASIALAPLFARHSG